MLPTLSLSVPKNYFDDAIKKFSPEEIKIIGEVGKFRVSIKAFLFWILKLYTLQEKSIIWGGGHNSVIFRGGGFSKLPPPQLER